MKTISVIGAGVMGRGIAYNFAINGYKVILNDISKEVLTQAENEIRELLKGALDRGIINLEQKETANTNMFFEIDLEKSVSKSDLVIEAIIENINVKTAVFKQLDRYCLSHTILATNTSTMSPTEIGAQTNRPDKVIAMHFFNPPYKMKLVELIRGLDTSQKTVESVIEYVESIGKEHVLVNEFPGFVTSRMNCLIGNEAMNLLMEGVASVEDIDKAMKLGLNHPMGPLELADLVGLDTRLRNMEYLHEMLGEKYRPCPLLIKYVKAGRLGRKSGRGFYDYE